MIVLTILTCKSRTDIFDERQVRTEVLSLFYGNSAFLLTLLDRKVDSISIFKWLKTIGKENAGRLCNVSLVYRKNQDLNYIKNELLPAMKKLGVNIDERMMVHDSNRSNGCAENDNDVVTVKRLKAPYCYCEGCIRRALTETGRYPERPLIHMSQ